MLEFNEYACGRLFAKATQIIFENVDGITVEDASQIAYVLSRGDLMVEGVQMNEVGLRALWQGTKGLFGKSADYNQANSIYNTMKPLVTGGQDPRWFKGGRDWWSKLRMMDANYKDQDAATQHSQMMNRQNQLKGLYQQYQSAGIPDDKIPDEVKNWQSNYDFDPKANRQAVSTDIHGNLLRAKTKSVLKNTGYKKLPSNFTRKQEPVAEPQAEPQTQGAEPQTLPFKRPQSGWESELYNTVSSLQAARGVPKSNMFKKLRQRRSM